MIVDTNPNIEASRKGRQPVLASVRREIPTAKRCAARLNHPAARRISFDSLSHCSSRNRTSRHFTKHITSRTAADYCVLILIHAVFIHAASIPCRSDSAAIGIPDSDRRRAISQSAFILELLVKQSSCTPDGKIR